MSEIEVTDELVALVSLCRDIELSKSEGQSDAAHLSVDYATRMLSVVYGVGHGRFVRATFHLAMLEEIPEPEDRGPYAVYASDAEWLKSIEYSDAVQEARFS